MARNKETTMSVKISTSTMAALDMVNAEQRVRTGRSASLSETIWALIETNFPHITERIASIENEKTDDLKHGS